MTTFHKQREIAVEARMFETEGLRFQPLLYCTRPPDHEELAEDPEAGPVRVGLPAERGPYFTTFETAHAWGLGWNARNIRG